MRSKTQLSIGIRENDRDTRERLARIRVLVADRDLRTAGLIQRVLFSFGLRTIDLTTHAEDTLERLRCQPYDFLITEWDMHPLDGLSLVRAIRTARDDNRIRRDIPILMLTSNTDAERVQAARDAGISEFVAKPFTAAAISGRILQILDNPRSFIESADYTGPCRRRRGNPPPGMADRRLPRGDTPHPAAPPPAAPTPLTEAGTAWHALMETATNGHTEGEYLDWARAEIHTLKDAFSALSAAPDDLLLQHGLLAAAAGVRKQAGIFGYELGIEVAQLLLDYISGHLPPNDKHLVVIAKHIDAVSVTFNPNVEQYGRSIARELIQSLGKLVLKLE